MIVGMHTLTDSFGCLMVLLTGSIAFVFCHSMMVNLGRQFIILNPGFYLCTNRSLNRDQLELINHCMFV